MEDFNQVMMDQLLEIGWEPKELPPLIRIGPPLLFREIGGYTGDRRASLTWWPAGTVNVPWRLVHDYALDERDLGEGTPDHSVWLWVNETLVALVRALEAGNYNAAPSALTQGSPFVVEDLEATMELVTFRPEPRPRRVKRGRGQRRGRR